MTIREYLSSQKACADDVAEVGRIIDLDATLAANTDVYVRIRIAERTT